MSIVSEINRIKTNIANSYTELEKVRGKNFAKLPEEYQEVEYIESTGTQYIDTGLTFDKINDIKMKLEITVLPSRASTAIFGANGSSDEVLLFYDETADRIYLNGTLIPYKPDINTIYDIDFNLTDGNASLTINNKVLGTSTGNSINKKCLLFGVISISTAVDISYYANYKLYRFEVIDTNNILVKHLIPCYRKSDNEIGLYDLVNNEFYINQGTGTFLKGNDVPVTKNSDNLPYIIKDYIKLVQKYIDNQPTQVVTDGVCTNALDVPLVGMCVDGNSEQHTYIGKNLFDINNMDIKIFKETNRDLSILNNKFTLKISTNYTAGNANAYIDVKLWKIEDILNKEFICKSYVKTNSTNKGSFIFYYSDDNNENQNKIGELKQIQDGEQIETFTITDESIKDKYLYVKFYAQVWGTITTDMTCEFSDFMIKEKTIGDDILNFCLCVR